MKTIQLSRGMVALVDDEDFEVLNKFRWHAQASHQKHLKTFYAKRWQTIAPKKQKLLLMHRVILGLTDSRVKTDHRNGNGLDNQKGNLRACTNQQNCFNQRKSPGTSSRFKGVSLNKRRNKWTAQIRVMGNLKNLGGFDREEDAADAYDRAAIKYFGDFAKPNHNQ